MPSRSRPEIPGGTPTSLHPLRLALSMRRAAALLGIDRNRTLPSLIRAGKLRTVPWGSGVRIPLVEVERLAREGWEAGSVKRRATIKPRPGVQDPEALRALDLTKL